VTIGEGVAGTGFEIFIKAISNDSVRFDHSRFFANARPEAVFRYFSKASVFLRFVKAMAVLICHGT
jgi:hypothetical protein